MVLFDILGNRSVVGREVWFPLPDQHSVPVNLPDPMQRNRVANTVLVKNLEGKFIARHLDDLVKRYSDDCIVQPVIVANFKLGTAKFRVPVDTVQQFMDRLHGQIALKLLISQVIRVQLIQWPAPVFRDLDFL